MPVAAGNNRRNVTLQVELWASLEGEVAEGKGKNVSHVVIAHIEASRAHTLLETQELAQILAAAEARAVQDMKQVVKKLDELAAKISPVSVPGALVVAQSPGPLSPPVPPSPPLRSPGCPLNWLRGSMRTTKIANTVRSAGKLHSRSGTRTLTQYEKCPQLRFT